MSTAVAEALTATPSITHVRHARADGHLPVQFHCYIHDEPVDVTVLKTLEQPVRAIQAAYTATKRDIGHIIVVPDTHTGARINQLLSAPVAKRSDNEIRLYTQPKRLTYDSAEVVTAVGNGSPAWRIRGTSAEATRSRVCELQYQNRVLATYDLENGTVTLEDSDWTTVERQLGEQTHLAIAPTIDRQTAPQPTTWRPVGLPLAVPSTAPLTQSSVYVLPDTAGDGLTPVNESPQSRGHGDESRYQQATALINRVLAQRTIQSSTETIPYDEFIAVASRQPEAEDESVSYRPLLNEVLANEDSVTLQRAIEDGSHQRQLCGRAWAIPSPASSD